jgi:hypothetical protein
LAVHFFYFYFIKKFFLGCGARPPACPFVSFVLMFKKELGTSKNTLLKSSDARKFREVVALRFPDLTPDQLSEVLPAKEGLVVQKLQRYNLFSHGTTLTRI